jgi:hypothetical protein
MGLIICILLWVLIFSVSNLKAKEIMIALLVFFIFATFLFFIIRGSSSSPEYYQEQPPCGGWQCNY